jgi:hypothetical protein
VSNRVKPHIVTVLKSIVIPECRPFEHNTAYGFGPPGYGMQFNLQDNAPDWLEIDTLTGKITGTAPKLRVDHEQFLITVTANIGQEIIEQDFFIVVACTDIIDTIYKFLKQLRHTPLIDHEKHEVLDFIFEYYIASGYKNTFIHMLRDHAIKLGISLSDEISYKDFKRVAEAEHPGIEKKLKQKLEAYHVLAEAEFTEREFHHLFRGGHQQLGVIPAVVWNYLGEASYYNWSELHSVLHEAVHAVREYYDFLQESEQLKPLSRPTP